MVELKKKKGGGGGVTPAQNVSQSCARGSRENRWPDLGGKGRKYLSPASEAGLGGKDELWNREGKKRKGGGALFRSKATRKWPPPERNLSQGGDSKHTIGGLSWPGPKKGNVLSSPVR